jgi:hypothetical protein
MSSTHSVKQASDQPPLYQNRDTLSATLSLENSVFLGVKYWFIFWLVWGDYISSKYCNNQNFAAVAYL